MCGVGAKRSRGRGRTEGERERDFQRGGQSREGGRGIERSESVRDNSCPRSNSISDKVEGSRTWGKHVNCTRKHSLGGTRDDDVDNRLNLTFSMELGLKKTIN